MTREAGLKDESGLESDNPAMSGRILPKRKMFPWNPRPGCL